MLLDAVATLRPVSIFYNAPWSSVSEKKIPFRTLGGPVCVLASTSAFRPDKKQSQVGFDIWVDGKPKGTSRIYHDEELANSHYAVIPVFLVLELEQGEHNIELKPFGYSGFNDEDHFNVTILPFPKQTVNK
jgi:hypothetical protein